MFGVFYASDLTLPATSCNPYTFKKRLADKGIHSKQVWAIIFNLENPNDFERFLKMSAIKPILMKFWAAIFWTFFFQLESLINNRSKKVIGLIFAL